MITREQQEAIFDALPHWIREAYHHEAVVKHTIFRGMALGMNAGEIADDVGKQVYSEYRRMRDEIIDRAMKSPAPSLFIPSNQNALTPP